MSPPRGLSVLPGSRVEAVLFDYGDTLVSFSIPQDALDDAYRRIVSLLVQRGFSDVPHDLPARIHAQVEAEIVAFQRGGSLEEMDVVAAVRRAYETHGLELPDSVLDDVLRFEQEAWWQGATVHPATVPTLERLRLQGLRIGLCSNAPYRAQSMHEQLVHLGLRHLFDGVTFSGDVGWRKPAGRIFQHALQELGATAEATVMVGDSNSDDVAGAQACGMRAVLLCDRPNSDAEPRATAADAVIHDLSELVPLLVPGH